MEKIQEQKALKLLEKAFDEEFSKSCKEVYENISYMDFHENILTFIGQNDDDKTDFIKLHTPSRKTDKESAIFFDGRNLAADINRLDDNFKEEKNLLVPQINWLQTGKDIITFEKLNGKNLKDIDSNQKENIVHNIIAIFYNMIFRDGFFCNLWAGNNVFFEKDKLVLQSCDFFTELSFKEKIFFAKQILKNKYQKEDGVSSACLKAYEFFIATSSVIKQISPKTDLYSEIKPKLKKFIDKNEKMNKDYVEFEGEIFEVKNKEEKDIPVFKTLYTTPLSERIFKNPTKNTSDINIKSKAKIPVWIMILIVFICIILANKFQ